MNKDELLKRLDRLDEDVSLVFGETQQFRLVIVGGGALVLLKYLHRSTDDIDALDVSSEVIKLLEKYDISLSVNAYINNFPYNYEDRLERINIGGRAISFYIISLEDIVISKLYSSREKDLLDITNENILNNLNWELLEKLALDEDEVKSSALNEKLYSEFKQSYEEYTKRYRK